MIPMRSSQKLPPDAVKLPRQRNRERTSFDLRLALHRLQKRSEKITIVAVAKEAGVSPALIHNKYPGFAEEIRKVMGKATRAQRDEKHDLLMAEREKNRALRAEIERLTRELRHLASENETLRREMAVQLAIASGNVVKMHSGDGY